MSNISRRNFFKFGLGSAAVVALKPVEALAGPKVVEVIKEVPTRPEIIIEEDGAVLENSILDGVSVRVKAKGVRIRACHFKG